MTGGQNSIFYSIGKILKPQSASDRSDLLLQPTVQAKIIDFCWFNLGTMRSVSFHAYLTAFTMWGIFRRGSTGTVKSRIMAQQK